MTLAEPGTSSKPTTQRLAIVAVVLAALLALAGGDAGRWVGAALVLWVAPALLAPLLRLPVVASVRPHLPLLLLGLLSLALLGDLGLGRPPATRDHGVHYFQTHILVNDLIPHGQLTGWSNRLNNGYPSGDSYPVLSYLWVGAAHLLSFGLVSLRASYAWGLLAIWLLSMWGIWQVAAIATAEIRARAKFSVAATISPAWAGGIAATLWLIDPGYSREGGWHYVMFHGVWPQLLSSALWVAAIPLSWRAFNAPSPRRIAVAGLASAGAALAHPFGILTVACSAMMWLLALWGTRAMRELPPGSVRVWLLIHVAAVVVSAGWVVGFLASADYMGRTPVPWLSLGELVTQLAAGELFERSRAFAGPLAVIGIVLAVRSGRAIAWLTLASLLAMLVASSEAAITVLRLDLVVSSFKNLQFPRYAMALKPLWFALAGVGGALVVGVLARRPIEPAAPSMSAGRLLACLLFGPLLVSVVDDASRLVPRPAGSVVPLAGSRYEVEEAQLLAALVAETAALGDQPATVAFFRTGMGGGTYPLFSIADAGARVVLDGHVPSVNFRYRVNQRSIAVLRGLGVTHVIHDQPLESAERALAEELEAVGVFGAYTLERVRAAEPSEAAPLRQLVHGPDGIEVLAWDDEHIELQIPELPAETPVQLTVAPYRKWVPRAEDGTALPSGGSEVLGSLAGLTFTPRGPGRVSIEYEKLPRERAAVWLSVLGLALCGAALAFGRPLSMAERLHSHLAHRISLGLGAATLALALLATFRRQHQSLEQTWAPVVSYHTKSHRLAAGTERRFARDLIDTRDYRVVLNAGDYCDGMLTKDSMPGCSPAEERPRVAMTYRSPFLYRCLRVTVPPRGWLDVIVEDLNADEAVLGFFKRDTRGRGGEHLRWLATGDERTRTVRSTRRHFHTKPEDHDGSFRISFSNDNPHPEQLCLSMATAQ